MTTEITLPPLPPRKRPTRRIPDAYSPWPAQGFITMNQMMAALGVKASQTVYNYIQAGLLPAPEPIGPNRIGWRVKIARDALDTLPDRVRRNGTGETLTARRIAKRAEAA